MLKASKGTSEGSVGLCFLVSKERQITPWLQILSALSSAQSLGKSSVNYQVYLTSERRLLRHHQTPPSVRQDPRRMEHWWWRCHLGPESKGIGELMGIRGPVFWEPQRICWEALTPRQGPFQKSNFERTYVRWLTLLPVCVVLDQPGLWQSAAWSSSQG